MKKVFLLLFLAFSYSSFAQDNYTSEKNLNAFNLLIFKTLDVTFENYIDQESSWGISALMALEGESRFNADAPYYYESLAITPFYKLYFGDRPNSGFFIEGFGNLSFGKVDRWYYDYDYCYECSSVYYPSNPIKSYTAFNVGLSLGKKWVTKKDITFSVFAGIGRALTVSNDGPGFFPRTGISIGKRK